MGVISIFNLSIEQYPDITPPVVEVSATYIGADAETVNNTVATPIAQSIMGVNNMQYMQATSANDGTMTLQVTFNVGSDADLDAIFTQNNVATATSELPSAVVQQGVTTRKTQTGFLMVYALSSDGRYDDEFLSNYAYINLQNRLLRINGVSKVSIMGAGEYAMRIWLRPDVLDYYNIAVDEIVDAIAVQAGVYPVGEFGGEPSPQNTQYTYTVTMPPQMATAKEFSSILIKTMPDGKQVRLHEVADVALGSQSYGTSSLFESRPTCVIVVYQEPESNAVALGKLIQQEMQSIAEEFPDGISYTTIVDGTASIKAGIKEIIWTLLAALVLVIFIIYVFIQDWRATIIPLVAIPVSIIGTFALFPLLGFSINIVSLLGLVLAIGLVVDDAIVVVEAVQVNIERGATPFDATVAAMRSVTSPIIATTVVLLAVFIPVSFSGGISGRLFQQFAVTISVSVLLSTINALTLSPALCAKLLRRRNDVTQGFFAKFNRSFDAFRNNYIEQLSLAAPHRRYTAASVAVMVATIIIAWRLLPAGFLPNEDQGYVMVFAETPAPSSLHVTEKTMQQIDAVLKSVPEIESTAIVSGFNMIQGIASSNCGVVFARLTDYSKRKLSAMEIAQLLTEQLYVAVPDAECYAFVQPAIPGLGVTSGITFELQDTEGRGSAYLASQAEKLIAALEESDNIESVTTQFDNGVPQRRLRIDREQALMKGVNLQQLYGEVSALLGGRYINSFSRFGRLYQTYIQAAPEYRQDSRSFDSYFITNAAAESVPLSSLIEVRDTVGCEFVSQFNLYRSIGITVTPQKGSSTQQVMKSIDEIGAATLPDDIEIGWSGVSYQENIESKAAWVVYLIAVIFVFLILAALYESWTLPFAIMLSVPTAVAGAMVAIGIAHLFSPTFINDIYTQISLVMLIGLSAKNSILVVEYADTLRQERSLSPLEATLEAAKIRLRPIFMTAFSFILGILPLIFASGVYSTARNIMGISLIGGMGLATILGIFIYPSLYLLVVGNGKKYANNTNATQQ